MASITPLSNLAQILSKLSDFIYLITGNEGEKVFDTSIKGYSICYHPSPHILTRIFSYATLQIKIIYRIIKVPNKIDLYVFFMSEGLLVPTLFCKLLRKPVLLILASSATKISEKQHDLLSGLFAFMETVNYQIADRIVVYSPKLIAEWGLEKYRHKIFIASNHFLDFDTFKMYTGLNHRDNLVGYVGRLSEEKGIINFVNAIPKILSYQSGINFSIGGDGKLKNRIETSLNHYNLNSSSKLDGWLSHDDLPQYFNKLKLLVIPSFTEGLPNVMIEAMACGTAVLATPVGAIPDFIKDAGTGFIMEDNSPECIAKNVIRAINHPCLERIANNGRRLVEKEFTFDEATKKFEEILSNLARENEKLDIRDQ